MPQARIGFFHHTPFPGADIFALLPWREDIIESLLACDLVGFHVPRFANNFAVAAASLVGAKVTRRARVRGRFLTTGTALAAPTMVLELGYGSRRVALGAFPVAVDSERIDAVRATPSHARRVAAIQHELAGQQVVLSVERLDYVKGPVERLLAFERLLDEHPEYREAVTSVNVVAPAADTIAVHRAVRDEVDMIVGRINGRFATLSWTPVRYFYRSLSFEEVVSWYAAASVAWITPLRDGLNLVSKEFVAATDGAAKVLVLSEFAGAHVELQHAVAVNPHSPAAMVQALRTALDMPDDVRRLSMLAMNRIVRARTPRDWATEFLAELEPSGPGQAHSNAAGQVVQRS
jgi:glucosylglycerol-phosphate synthase